MFKVWRQSRLVVLVATGLSFSGLHHADASGRIRYVSNNGSNANDCLLATPCRTLQRGIDATPSGGELRVLDSGFFGQVAQITRSMSISGVDADVSLSTMELIINAPNAIAIIRKLNFIGHSSKSIGIRIQAAKYVAIEDSRIEGYTSIGLFAPATAVENLSVVRSDFVRSNQGLVFESTNPLAGLHVSNSTFRFNGTGLSATIDLPTGGAVAITQSVFSNNDTAGLSVIGPSISIDQSSISANRVFGLHASGGTFGSTKVHVSRSLFSGNGAQIDSGESTLIVSHTSCKGGGSGIVASFDGRVTVSDSVIEGNSNLGVSVATGVLRLSRNTIVRNGTGVQIGAGGLGLTRGDNTIEDNATDVSGVLTLFSAK